MTVPIVLNVNVGRSGLSLPDLNISAMPYQIIDFGPGTRTRRRNTVANDWVHGELLISSPLAEAARMLSIRVYGNDALDMWTNYKTLATALDQDSYTILGSLTYAGTVANFHWNCEPADIETAMPAAGGAGAKMHTAGVLDKFAQMSKYQEFVITIPGSPVPGDPADVIF